MQILGQRRENEEEGVEILRRSRERSSTRDDLGGWRVQKWANYIEGERLKGRDPSNSYKNGSLTNVVWRSRPGLCSLMSNH
jgi:hypothetical protein